MFGVKKIIGTCLVLAMACFFWLTGCFEFADNGEVPVGDCVYFRRDNKIWLYNNGQVKKYSDKKAAGDVKFDGKNIYWYSKKNEAYGYIYMIDTVDNSKTKFKTELTVYDLEKYGDEMILSGKNNNDFTYGIVVRNLQSGEENYVSNTQNDQVEFSYYNGEIYYFEPEDDNKLYKYNIESQETTKVSDLVYNKSNIKMNLCVNEDGIFFTKTEVSFDSDESDLYKLSLEENTVVDAVQNIDDIIGFEKGFLYCVDESIPNTVYKISTEDYGKAPVFSYETFQNAYIQGNYLICEDSSLQNENEGKFFIVDIGTGETVLNLSGDELN